MTAWGLAWRTIARSPARSVLAVAGVTVIGALLFNMLLLSRGLLVSFRDLLDTAGFDIRVVAADGSMVHRPPIAGASSLADAIAHLPGVRRVTLVRTDSAEVIVPDRRGPAVRVALLGTTDSGAGGVLTLVSGAPLPSTGSPHEPPLIVSARMASDLGLAPGSTLKIRPFVSGAASALPPVTARIVGIGAFAFEAPDESTVATTLEGFAATHGTAADGRRRWCSSVG
jgi:hypothetical protein